MINIKSNLFFKKTIMGGPEQQPVPNTQEQAQETPEQQKTPEQEISDRANILKGKILIKYRNYDRGIMIKEDDGGLTIITINEHFLYHLVKGDIRQPITFYLKNYTNSEDWAKSPKDEIGSKKKYKIEINSHGKMSVNGKNIPNEKAQMFLDKIEANISQVKKAKDTKEIQEKQASIKEVEQLLKNIDF